MKLTEQQIHSAGTCGIGFNFHQLYVLGVPWPPKHGWIQRLAGADVSEEQWELVLLLKGKRRGERRQILSQKPFMKEIFMRKCDYKDRVVELEKSLTIIRDGLVEDLCCEPDGSPDQNFAYCEQCQYKLKLIAVAEKILTT